MPSTMPLRVGDDLLASAKLAADAAGRSAAQQIGYWAKLGRELERSRSVSVREIAEVLAGARSYDGLDPKAQASVRAEWDARIEARRAALNLAELFKEEGRSWVEAGPDGATVRHPAAGEHGSPRRRRPSAAVGKETPSRKASRSTKKAAGDGKSPQPVRSTATKRKQGTPRGKNAQAAAKKATAKKATARKTSTRTR